MTADRTVEKLVLSLVVGTVDWMAAAKADKKVEKMAL